MQTNKHVAKSLERQQIRTIRRFYHAIAEINLALAKVHSTIGFTIDKEKYKYATAYVDQYVSYTSVWNIKFVYNLENPEVALLQLFHLQYILQREPAELYTSERNIIEEQWRLFNIQKPYKNDQIIARQEKMLAYIAAHENAVVEE
ncbi:hypothetical protein [Solibacillus sp. CAU 1738]|uniref:hypothetical protein n=1 Tax=Solibacillus sp. CAU 1738 TaxID=3140363 RepID=UPI00326061B2